MFSSKTEYYLKKQPFLEYIGLTIFWDVFIDGIDALLQELTKEGC